MLGFAYVPMLVFVHFRLVKNHFKRIICLHNFIERVIHSIRVSCLGLLMFGCWCSFATCEESLQTYHLFAHVYRTSNT